MGRGIPGADPHDDLLNHKWWRAAAGTVSFHIHLTGDPADIAARTTAFLAKAEELLLADLIVGETIFVLEFVKAPRAQIANAMRSLVAMDNVVTIDSAFPAARARGLRTRPARLR